MEAGKYLCPNIVSRKDILDKTKQKMKKKNYSLIDIKP